MKVLRNGKAIELPDDSEKASRMLMDAADFFAATLAKADPRAWERLLTYRPISPSFQARVDAWLVACFGEDIARDPIERNHRFLEEALELVQSTGCTHSEAHQLVDYVFGRETGDPQQEIGGVMNTLAALCLARGFDMADSGDIELKRCWTKIEKIRAKQAAKPKHSPLPQSALPPPDPRDALIGTDVSDAAIADATIERLSADLAAAREALEEADAIINEGVWESPSRQWMERVNACFVKTRAVLAKLSGGR